MINESSHLNSEPISSSDLGEVKVEVPDIRFGTPPPPPVKK